MAAACLAGCETTPKNSATPALPEHNAVVATTSTAPADPAKLGAKLNEQLMSAIERMSAEDAKARDDAFAEVTQVLAKNARDVAYVQRVINTVQGQMTTRLAAMLTTDDEEARARLCTVLEFNEAFSTFCIDMLEQPPEMRQRLLTWSSDSANVLLVGQVYSRNTDTRRDSAKRLSALKSDEADFLLARLLLDESREVSLMAVDAAESRMASERVLDAVWRKAVELPLEYQAVSYGGLGGISRKSIYPGGQQRTIFVRGRQIYLQDMRQYLYYNSVQDAWIAGDLLVESKSPAVEKRLADLLRRLDQNRNDSGVRFRPFLANYNNGNDTLARLCQVYKPKEYVAFLMRGVASNSSEGYDTTINGQQYRQSSRIELINLVVQFTEQDKDEYKLTRMANWGNRTMIAGSIKEEEELARKLIAWWRENYKKYGADDPKLEVDGPVRIKGSRFVD